MPDIDDQKLLESSYTSIRRKYLLEILTDEKEIVKQHFDPNFLNACLSIKMSYYQLTKKMFTFPLFPAWNKTYPG